MDTNSAYALGALYNIQKQQQQDEAQKKEILLKGAEANVQQNELLLKQLEEIKQQNVLLMLLGKIRKLSSVKNEHEGLQTFVEILDSLEKLGRPVIERYYDVDAYLELQADLARGK